MESEYLVSMLAPLHNGGVAVGKEAHFTVPLLPHLLLQRLSQGLSEILPGNGLIQCQAYSEYSVLSAL